MCEYLEYDVTKLKRTRIMNVSLGNLATDQWRELTDAEMNQINAMVSDSSKTEEASKDNQKKQVNPNPQSKRKFASKKNTRFQPKSNRNSPPKRKRRG
jgi:23S rRNA pseudouridine2604 synthase